VSRPDLNALADEVIRKRAILYNLRAEEGRIRIEVADALNDLKESQRAFETAVREIER
jgi:hypothetical protein